MPGPGREEDAEQIKQQQQQSAAAHKHRGLEVEVGGRGRRTEPEGGGGRGREDARQWPQEPLTIKVCIHNIIDFHVSHDMKKEDTRCKKVDSSKAAYGKPFLLTQDAIEIIC